jgi:sodium transport system permease protein
VALIVPAGILLATDLRKARRVFGGGIGGGRLAGSAILLGATLWVASVGLMQLQSVLFPPSDAYLEMFRRIHHALAPSGLPDALASLLVIAVLPGLCEELLMRGVLLTSLEPRVGRTPAIAASALLFAAIHLDPYRFLFTLTIGVVLGFVRLRSGSLWPPALAHLTLNGITFAIAPLVDDPSKPETPDALLGTAALLLGAATTAGLLRFLQRTGAPGEA